MKKMQSISQLASLESSVSNMFEHVSLRGLADGPFLFAQHGERSAEVSTNDGQWWIEFWNKSDDEDAPPVKEITLTTEGDVCDALLNWLLG